MRGLVVREVGGRACRCLPVERRARRRKAALFDYQTTRSMLLTKMDLLNYQYLDKMNNNIGILCYEGKRAPLGCLTGSVWPQRRKQKLAAPSSLWGQFAPSFQEPSRENSLGVGTLARAEIWCPEPTLTEQSWAQLTRPSLPPRVLYFTFRCHPHKMVPLTFNLNEVNEIIYWIDDPVVVISPNH